MPRAKRDDGIEFNFLSAGISASSAHGIPPPPPRACNDAAVSRRRTESKAAMSSYKWPTSCVSKGIGFPFTGAQNDRPPHRRCEQRDDGGGESERERKRGLPDGRRVINQYRGSIKAPALMLSRIAPQKIIRGYHYRAIHGFPWLLGRAIFLRDAGTETILSVASRRCSRARDTSLFRNAEYRSRLARNLVSVPLQTAG